MPWRATRSSKLVTPFRGTRARQGTSGAHSFTIKRPARRKSGIVHLQTRRSLTLKGQHRAVITVPALFRQSAEDPRNR
jgi:hypothetical protein